jgi:predicted transposase/invertase (TIGR01784 family)
MPYDTTCKFIAEQFTPDIATWLLGQPIPLTKLQPSELSIEPIRADTIVLLQSKSLILHIEFQVDPQPDVPFRCADYRLRIHRRYPKRTLHQED